MPNEFTVGARTADADIDGMMPLGMSAEGAGAATYMLAWVAGSTAGGVVGLLLVGLGAAALFAHLGHPLRGWRVLARTGRTWMSNGAVTTGALIVLGTLVLFVPRDGAASMMLQALSLVCTFVVVLYAGFLFTSMAVPLWSTPIVPILFLLHSLASAAVLMLGLHALAGAALAAHAREVALAVALLGATLALTRMLPRWVPPSAAGQASVRLLATGRYGRMFNRLGLVAGLVLPLLLVTSAYLASDSVALAGALVIVAVTLRLAGDVGVRTAVLRAGVYAPVV